ncbi:MAG: hypothetical protein ACK528_01690 [Alphaproteobacteria bacterium]
MTLDGVELFFSPLANEILRELKTALFTGEGDGTQTHQAGLCEGVLVMWLLAKEDRAGIAELRKMSREARARCVLDFYLDHEAGIDALKPEILARMESIAAAIVESEAGGKPRQPAPDSSPP